LQFLQLNAFFLLILPLILSVYLLLFKQNSFSNYFSPEILEKLTISNQMFGRNVKNTLFICILILFTLSLARPVMQMKEHKIQEDLIPIIVAIDVSKSMLANDIYPNRLSLAKQKLLKIIQNIKQSAVGVVLFAKSAFVLSPITQDFTSLTFLVNNLDTGLNFDNGSNVLAMLEASNDLLEDYNSKNIILLSDGGNKDNYEKEIEFAQEHNIKIYAIGIASSKRSPIPSKGGFMTDSSGQIVTVGLNKNISKLAMQSKGGYIDFSLNTQDINAILKDISNEAQKEFMNSSKIKTYTELFYYPLALALFLLFLNFSSLSIKKNQATLLLSLIFIFQTQNLQADLLDFISLKDAKEAYINKDYKQAESLYKKVDKNGQTQYNIANSLYNQKKYKEAQEYYQNIKTQDKNLQYKSLHNLGNTYVKQNNLEEAKKSYEDALKIKDDIQTKQNLDTVNKALKEQQKQEDKNKKNNQKNKDQNNKDKKSSDKNKKDNDQKNKQNKQNKKDKNKSKKEQEEQLKKKQQSEEKKDKDAKNKQKSNQKKQNLISDMEEKKWLNQLKDQKNRTFLRRFETKSSDDNIKNPW